MFDINSLDGMNFGQLGETLNHVLERMKELKAETPEGEDDPRHDVLLVIANQIIVRMDSIARDNMTDSPELDEWKRVSDPYRKTFDNYVRTYLKDGVPLLVVEPEGPSDADAAWQAKVDELALDEKSLEGMSAGDLFQMNRFIAETVERLDEEWPEDRAEPVIKKLLNFGNLVFRRLDPLVREAYRDRPEKLAEWMAIVDDYQDLDDGVGEEVRADIESSEVS
jgi:hypothetical protein